MTEEPPDPTRYRSPSLKRLALQELTNKVISGLEEFIKGQEINGHAQHLNALRENISGRIEVNGEKYRVILTKTDSIVHILRATTHYFGDIEPQEFPRKIIEFAEGLDPETINRETAKRYLGALLKLNRQVDFFGNLKPKG